MDVKGPPALRLGSDIEIYCRYCRLNLDGVVSAFGEDGALAKVKCGTCGHFQNFKAPVAADYEHRKLVAKAMRIAEKHTRGADATRGGGGKKAGVTGAAAASDLSQEAVMRRIWDEATANVTPMKMKIYDRFRSYHKDDVITHKAHGLGVVVRDDVEGSITVLFRDAVHDLECDVPRDD